MDRHCPAATTAHVGRAAAGEACCHFGWLSVSMCPLLSLNSAGPLPASPLSLAWVVCGKWSVSSWRELLWFCQSEGGGCGEPPRCSRDESAETPRWILGDRLQPSQLNVVRSSSTTDLAVKGHNVRLPIQPHLVPSTRSCCWILFKGHCVLWKKWTKSQKHWNSDCFSTCLSARMLRDLKVLSWNSKQTGV